ncbi:MAG: TetR family transcriptional regulator [Solirubrobacteraceae bacterium]
MSARTGVRSREAEPERRRARAVSTQPLYEGLRPRWSGLDRAGVVAHQRLRLHGAMLDAANRGDAMRTSVAELARLAGVSKRTVYDCFGSKEELFLATYDYVLMRSIALMRRESSVAGLDSDGQLAIALRALLTGVDADPGAARIALVETLSAGPAALARLEHGRRLFEAMTASALPHGDALPPLVLKGIVGGVERVLRARVVDGGVPELLGHAGDLAAWVRRYEAHPARRAAAVHGSPVARRPTDWRAWLRCEDPRTRLLRVAATLAAREGHAALTPERIVHEARLPPAAFEDSFESAEDCFLASLDLLVGVEALAVAMRAGVAEPDWRVALARGLHALLAHIAAHPVLGRAAFVEAFTLHPATLERRAALARRFADACLERVPACQAPSPLVIELACGAISTLIHHLVASGARRALPTIAGDVCFVALAAIVGAEEAASVVVSALA